MTQDKKIKIINSAFKLFSEHGFHGTTTAKIAKEAKVATGTLFTYFSTKDELINELYLQLAVELHEHLINNVDLSKNNYVVLKDVWIKIIQWYVENDSRFLFHEQYSSSPYVRYCKDDIETEYSFFLGDILEGFITDGTIKKQDPKIFKLYYEYSARSIALHFINNKIKFDNKIADLQFEILWNGLKNN